MPTYQASLRATRRKPDLSMAWAPLLDWIVILAIFYPSRQQCDIDIFLPSL